MEVGIDSACSHPRHIDSDLATHHCSSFVVESKSECTRYHWSVEAPWPDRLQQESSASPPSQRQFWLSNICGPFQQGGGSQKYSSKMSIFDIEKDVRYQLVTPVPNSDGNCSVPIVINATDVRKFLSTFCCHSSKHSNPLLLSGNPSNVSGG